METLAFQGLVGLSLAMYLWLVSAGLTIIFGVLGVINFAHGSLFMLGAYFAFTFYGLLGWNFWLAIGLSYGALLGLERMVLGGHFASDVVWSAGFVYLIGLALYYLLKLDREIWWQSTPAR